MDLPHSCLRSIHDSFTNHSRSRKWVRRWRAVCLRLTFGACGTRPLTLATDAVSKGAGEVGRGRAGAGRSASSAQLPTAACPVLRRCHLAGVDWPADGGDGPTQCVDRRDRNDVAEGQRRPMFSAEDERLHAQVCKPLPVVCFLAGRSRTMRCFSCSTERASRASSCRSRRRGGHAVIPGRAWGRRACDLGGAALISCSGPCTSM